MWFRNELSSLAEVSLYLLTVTRWVPVIHQLSPSLPLPLSELYLWTSRFSILAPMKRNPSSEIRGGDFQCGCLPVLTCLVAALVVGAVLSSVQPCNFFCEILKLGRVYILKYNASCWYWNIYNWCKGNGKAVPLQTWSGPEGSRKIRFPDFMTMAQNGGKVVSLTHRPPLSPGNTPGTHFC